MTAPQLVAVVTVVAGRHGHLRTQRAFLAEQPPDLHVVVAIADRDAQHVADEQDGLPTQVIHLPTTPAGLPVAAARNAGAAAALAAGADVLVFLDVDCIPAPDLLARYRSAVHSRADALVCGPVTYLPPAPPGGWTSALLARARDPHPARPDPDEGELLAIGFAMFWSLSFALTARLWHEIGGFYEGFVGYGGEDTDFARTAERAGVPIVMAGRADAFHQHHPVSAPPVEHLDDIVRNSAVYQRRHGELPMAGWLAEFTDQGLLQQHDGLPQRADAVRLVTVPARHAYLDAVLPPSVRRVEIDRTVGWEPDPLLRPDDLRRAGGGIDVVHVHFGYDHLSPQDMDAWVCAVHAAGLALMVTVHDLRNPHHDEPYLHDAHLRTLVRAADRVITLTESAARELRSRYGRQADVIAHPTLLDDVEPAFGRKGQHVLLPLKALRRNVREPLAVVAAAAEGAATRRARLRVLVEPAALEQPALRGLTSLDVDLDVSGWLPHDDVLARVAAAHAVVLPYRFGTHSGWIELARDLGTHVVAPDCGHYAAQWQEVVTYGNNEIDGLDAASLSAAVAQVCAQRRPDPADRAVRAAQRDLARAHHDVLYRQVAGR